MRLIKARVQKYRSVRDSGDFDIESLKTILVGPNEAGKTAILQALQQLNPPEGVKRLDPLRDYPRSEYNDISTGVVKPEDVTVVTGEFALEASDLAELSPGFDGAIYRCGRRFDNKMWHDLQGGPIVPKYSDLQNDLVRLASHVDSQQKKQADGGEIELGSVALTSVVGAWVDRTVLSEDNSTALAKWLTTVLPHVDETNSTETKRHASLVEKTKVAKRRAVALQTLYERIPTFVLFSNYFRVRPSIHLDHLAQRIKSKILDDDQYDYGNQCLLKLLGFTARELSDLGNASAPDPNNKDAFQAYKDQLDKRSYQLNAASVRLTDEIKQVWQPVAARGEADRLRVVADGQYLKVTVEDDLGVDIELDQRSEGFQWIVSFFVVFFAESMGNHKNAILLLDEPGMSLHGLKQREFQSTLSKLAEKNQTIYTTHSPFLVGANELDIVRVVEMPDRKQGTQVHNGVLSTDPGALLPLQEALGYDLAQSLFSMQRNLVLEGLTDYWYIDSVAQLLADAGEPGLNDKIALVPAQTAGKIVYYATILHSNKLKVAALLDSDAAGDQAAKQEILVHQLGSKGILRTKDVYQGAVGKPEIEDLLRETLIKVAASELGWDVAKAAAAAPTMPINDLFSKEIPEFKKYRLAKAFIRWTRAVTLADLQKEEIDQWKRLLDMINKALK